MRIGRAFEVSERLKKRDLQADVTDHPADVTRTAIERQEVVLEDLDAVKPGPGDCLQLFREFAADRYCCDGRPHRRPPAASVGFSTPRVRSAKCLSMRSAS